MFFSIFFVSISACGSSEESKLDLGNILIIKGNINSVSQNSSAPEFNFIDSMGLREPAPQLRWSATDGSFEIKYFSENLKPFAPKFWPSLLKMAKVVPEEKSQVRLRSDLTLEVVFREAANALGISAIKFLQTRFAITALDEISGSQVIDLGNLSLRGALSVRTNLKDKAPLGPESFGLLIPYSQEISESPNTPWDLLKTAPVQLKPLSESQVLIEPILDEIPEFYFYYNKSENCQQIVGKFLVSEFLKKPEFDLLPCDRESGVGVAENSSAFAFFEESESLVLPSSSVKEVFGKEPHLYTNANIANIGLIAKSNEGLTEIRVEVFNSESIDTEPVLIKELSTFTSKFSIDLPATFTLENGSISDSGPFTLKISSKISAKTGASVSKSADALVLRGFRNVARPILVGDSIIDVVSENEDFNLVNGVENNLKVLSSFCSEAKENLREQRKIGLSLSSLATPESIVYVNCPKDPAQSLSFPADKLLSLALQSSAENVLVDARFFLVNEFGSSSDNDLADNKNVVKIYIDFNKPDLVAKGYLLGQQMGVTAAGNASSNQATTYCNFSYTNCIFSQNSSTKGPTRLKFDSSGLVTNAIFRFAEKQSCELSPVVSDGPYQPYDQLSSEILRFAIAPVGVTFESSEQFIPCGNDYELRRVGLSKPSLPSENIRLNIQVIDGSGVKSDPLTLEIEPCGAVGIESKSVCWEE